MDELTSIAISKAPPYHSCAEMRLPISGFEVIVYDCMRQKHNQIKINSEANFCCMGMRIIGNFSRIAE